MTPLRIWFLLVLMVMVVATSLASTHENVVTAFVRLAQDPWGLATLLDAYFAFVTVWLWIAWRERCRWVSLVWLVAILLLGNFAIAAYALVALKREGSLEGLFRTRGSHG